MTDLSLDLEAPLKPHALTAQLGAYPWTSVTTLLGVAHSVGLIHPTKSWRKLLWKPYLTIGVVLVMLLCNIPYYLVYFFNHGDWIFAHHGTSLLLTFILLLNVAPVLTFSCVSTMLSGDTTDLTHLLTGLDDHPEHSEHDFRRSCRNVFGWTVVLGALYLLWGTLEVFATPFPLTAKILFGLLMVTFPMRLLLPLLGVMLFELTAFGQIAALRQFRDLHRGHVNVTTLAQSLRKVVRQQIAIEQQWSILYFALLVIPYLCLVASVFCGITASLQDKVTHLWFFACYTIYYLYLSSLVLWHGSQLTAFTEEVARDIQTRIACGDVSFHHSKTIQMDAYLGMLRSLRGFVVLGIRINYRIFTTILGMLIPIVILALTYSFG